MFLMEHEGGYYEPTYNLTLSKMWLHFKKICQHKRWVFHYCRMFGITWRGIKHDLSKFSPTEFFESAKYYVGTKSPIDVCKSVNGFSKAWLHHKGRNTHHYEHWQDNFDNGGGPIVMPFEDSLEMLADYLGAGKAYMGIRFTFENEYNWWTNKLNNPIAMHSVNKRFITLCLRNLMKSNAKGSDIPPEQKSALIEMIKNCYNNCYDDYVYGGIVYNIKEEILK